MAWNTPTLVEICIGLEINGYLPAEFWFRPCWVGHLPPWYLLADMPFGMGRRRAGAAREVGCGQARLQLPSLRSRSNCRMRRAACLASRWTVPSLKQPNRAVAL